MKTALVWLGIGAIVYLIWKDMGKFQSRNVAESIDVLGEELKIYAGQVNER